MKPNIKRLCILLLPLALLAACRKNSSGPKDIFLSKVTINGEPDEEYIYNSDKQLAEEKIYSKVLGVVLHTSTYKYNYDQSGKLKEAIQYQQIPLVKPVGKWVYTLDGSGRIARMSAYSLTGADSGKLYTHIDITWNASNQVIKQTWRDSMENASSFRNLSYYANGNMKSNDSYNISNNIANKVWSSTYGSSDSTVPVSMLKISAFPVNFYYNYLVTPSISNYTYSNGLVSQETKEVLSLRKYNDKGLLIQATVTTKKIKPLGTDDLQVMQFEYVEL